MALSSKRERNGQPKGKLTAKLQQPSPKDTPEDNANDTTDSEEEEEEDDDDDDSEGSSTDSGTDDDLSSIKKNNKKKKTRRNKSVNADEFAQALTSILSQDARGSEAAPIMAKDRTRETQIKEEILEYRARKAIVHEKRLLMSKDRVVPDMRNFDYERKLRKVATRGVVKLFNVVKAQQTELSAIESVPSVKTKQVADMSKSKFLDLLKAKK